MRQRGFTFVEVMIYVGLFGGVCMTVGAVARGLHQTDRASAAYTRDLAGLRRAVRLVEDDLRHARSLDDLDYVLDDGALKRAGRVVARRVDRFELAEEDGVVTVTLGLAPRAAAATRRAVVRTRVRMRNRGAER